MEGVLCNDIKIERGGGEREREEEGVLGRERGREGEK